MTDSDQPMTVGQKDSTKTVALVFGVSIDAMLIVTAFALLADANTVTVSVVLGVVLLIVVLGTLSTWFFWRLARIRLEISEDGIIDIGLLGRRFVPTDQIRRVDVVDGRSLRRPRTGGDDQILYLPVVRTGVSPGEIPVLQLAADNVKDAEVNADSLRWLLDRANCKSAPLDTTGRPAISWEDDGKR